MWITMRGGETSFVIVLTKGIINKVPSGFTFRWVRGIWREGELKKDEG